MRGTSLQHTHTRAHTHTHSNPVTNLRQHLG